MQSYPKLLSLLAISSKKSIYLATVTYFVNEVFTCDAQTDTIYFDIRKAFDSVSHCGLQVFQANSGPGSNHIYQTDPSLQL